ncbi:hypothetical protein SKAU_G00101920 [Synaphobranchus kaupii]|uniref:Uncharacterized protein n=1 Tax=Synaphobranchus kaupii TaxID=118154 RepID=A0A9Q1FYE4_SYNKA|nr:hypothetical protein SKAU_G00101920 [Synaphobranchus kaupii]
MTARILSTFALARKIGRKKSRMSPPSDQQLANTASCSRPNVTRRSTGPAHISQTPDEGQRRPILQKTQLRSAELKCDSVNAAFLVGRVKNDMRSVDTRNSNPAGHH